MIKVIAATLLMLFASFSAAQIVTVPIPGAPGLSVTIGTGVNALPLQNIQNNPNAINTTMGDDDWRSVALPYTFPYFGRNFNQSWMLSNGAVTFQDPATNAYGMCCSGMDLSTLTDTRYNYTIFGVWTDLIATNPNSHYYLHQGNSTTYGWYNVNQYGTGNQNSFEIKIDSSGLVDTRISGALVSYAPVTSGMTGDLSQGQYFQYYYGQGINIPNGAGISWQALSGTGDICSSNPLSSPSCPGYTEAQCTINPLFSPSCPGYQQAYFTQQCTANPLYSPSCPGYAEAYFTQQCTLDPLYNSQCPGYAEAYAKKYVLNIDTSPSSSTSQTTTTTTSVSTTQPTTTINTDGTVSTAVSTTGDTNVDKAITSTTTTTNTASAPAAPVQLTQPTTTTTTAVQTQQTKTETKTVATVERKEQTKTETKAETKKDSEMKQAANAKAKEEMKKAENASSFESQVAVQANVIGAMSFVPGFSAYAQANVPDVLQRQLQRQYGRDVIDNRVAGRRLFGGSDRLHEQMINQQWEQK